MDGAEKPEEDCILARNNIPVRDTNTEADADTDTASHLSSASLPGGEYDVFLSFRGPNTRYGFSDFLYTSLINSGVRAFRDDEELRKGRKLRPELENAIRQSKISIPIFSPDYAHSKWCLLEVDLMRKCERQLILPICYHVTPDEVKDQPAGGTYEAGFEKQKASGDINDETINEWKEALKEVGGRIAWELKKDSDK